MARHDHAIQTRTSRHGPRAQTGRHGPLPISTCGGWLRDRAFGEARDRAMIEHLIRWSVRNRFLVLLVAVFAAAWGIWALKTTPVDALPDLSDVQVILRTNFP